MTKKKVAETIYLLCSIIGATIIAFNLGYNVIGYSLFLFGGLSSLYLILISNVSRSMLIVTNLFIIIDVIGIVRYY